MTSRHGPLTALEGTAPALAVGDVLVRHLRLTPAGVAWHAGDVRREFVPWVDVDRLSVDVPKTWMPHPLVSDWTRSIIETALGGGADYHHVEPYFARVAIRGGDEELWEVDRHYVSGYRRRDARAAARLVDHLGTEPSSRALLAQPSEIIARISTVLRAAG